jgi:hypothetical protein
LTAPPLPDDSAPRFFITSYTWLGYNQADEWASGDDETNEFIRLRRLQILMSALTFDDSAQATAIAAAAWKTGDRITDWQALSIPENSPPGRIRSALHTAARIWHPTLHPGDSTVHWRWHRITTAARDLLHLSDTAERKLLAEIDSHPALGEAADTLATIEENIGHIRYYDDAPDHPVKCVFRPTLASLLCHVFDFVVCDEAVRLKSGTSYQAQGVLRMTPRCRYALTGTPIKNKLPDFFFLASWVTGHHRLATARWPYGNDTPDRGQFSRDFGVLEENLTAMEKAVRNGKKAPPPKTTNHICNVHRLWRILGPVVIRRRKDDAGADCQIVDKTIHPIRVMPGTRQKKIYGFHLRSAPPKRSILASIGAQLQNLRQAALNPCSNKLTHGGKNGRSDSPWTPKYAAILQLAIDLLPQGEQLVIFSPFQDFSRSLAARFRDAGIRHLVLDGNTTPEKRGSAIKEFKSGAAAVLIAGIDSMGEGHSLDCCRHLVLPSLSWAFDSNTQAVERVHRLTSRKDVSIYVILTTGTIDVRLASIWQEKGDSSDLALDGRLTEKHHEEVDLGKLLRDAVKEFDPKADSIDEDEVRAQWNSTLLPALTAAGKAYITKRQTTTATTPDTTTRPAPAAPAPVANRPRSLFDLMKNNNRPTPQPTPQAPTQPNIIPFPGMLGRPKLAGTSSARPSQEHPVPAPAKPAYSMPRVNIAELLRQSTAKR